MNTPDVSHQEELKTLKLLYDKVGLRGYWDIGRTASRPAASDAQQPQRADDAARSRRVERDGTAPQWGRFPVSTVVRKGRRSSRRALSPLADVHDAAREREAHAGRKRRHQIYA